LNNKNSILAAGIAAAICYALLALVPYPAAVCWTASITLLCAILLIYSVCGGFSQYVDFEYCNEPDAAAGCPCRSRTRGRFKTTATRPKSQWTSCNG
jgi:hypothetical protein